jgi:GNAT superfamily N-acetyltransferase
MVPPAEWLERRALEELHAATPGPVRERMGLRSEVVGTALVSVASREPSILWNRAIGLGVESPARPEDLQRIRGIYEDAGVTRFFLHLHPQAKPTDLRDRMAEAGLEKARGWMKFERDASPATVRTDLRVERVGPEWAGDFGRIVAGAFDFTEAAGEALAALNGRPGWHRFMSFDGEEPAGTGVLFVSEGFGWLDMGATRPEFRGRHSQQAVLAARIRYARECACHALFTTTGEEVPDDPQISYANILKMGFREAYLRENYAPPRR